MQQHRCGQVLSKKPIPLRGAYRLPACCRARQKSEWTTAINISEGRPIMVPA